MIKIFERPSSLKEKELFKRTVQEKGRG